MRLLFLLGGEEFKRPSPIGDALAKEQNHFARRRYASSMSKRALTVRWKGADALIAG
ncbi:MAG: hypothetical protein HYS06_13635 [Methylocystis sp.]|nr:hypothetical protein [Methylocystis sp.]